MKSSENTKKKVALTEEARIFLLSLDQEIKEQFTMLCRRLEKDGFLIWPYAEKLEGYADLFAMRIISGNNVRFFYFYVDRSEQIWVLSGYEKRTRKIPLAEVKKALRIKKEIGGGK